MVRHGKFTVNKNSKITNYFRKLDRTEVLTVRLPDSRDLRNSNRNLKIYKALLKRLSAPGHHHIHERCDESKWGSERGVMRSSGPIFRIPGGDRVAVKVSVVQMEKVNDHYVSG